MNYSIISKNKVIYEENNIEKTIDYSDNIEDILIERITNSWLENTINENNLKLEEYKERKSNIKKELLQLLIIAIVSFPLLHIFYSIKDGYNLLELFKEPLMNLISIIISGGTCSILCLLVLISNIFITKSIKTIENDLEYLTEEKNKSDKKLAELEVQKTKNKDITLLINKKINIDERKKLFKIKQRLLVMENYIRNKRKYDNLYQNQELDKYLRENEDYCLDEIAFINSIIEENDVLLKSRKK